MLEPVMNPCVRIRRFFGTTALLTALTWSPAAVESQERTGVVRVQVTPDREDWTYAPGASVRFRITVTRDGHPLPGASVTYGYGPEMLPPSVEKSAAVPSQGLTIDAGTLREPGFLRLVATAEVDRKKYRGLGTAGFAPDRIRPTVEDPPDFDVFWTAGKDALAKLPIDAKLTPLPDLSTSKVDVYHVSLQNLGVDGTGTSRFYAILAEPKGEGRFPAVLNVPGAGVRPYRGLIDLAEKGMITLQVGIHGVPVNLEPIVYDGLRAAGLSGYWAFNLDDRERYYSGGSTWVVSGPTTSWRAARSGTAGTSWSRGAARAERSRSSPPRSTLA